MRSKLSIGSAFLLLTLAYLASPYVALWRLEAALETGDTLTLEQGVDWKSVREGLKQDIADGVIGPVQAQLAANTLPPFGSSFITGIADTAVDREVTPKNLVAVMRQMRPSESAGSPLDCFAWAFFDGLTTFTVTVKNADEESEDGHLRLLLKLQHGRWTLMRAWVPQEIVERAAQRT